MFIKKYEELSSNEADVVIDMDVEDDLETMVSCAVDGLFQSKILTGPGGVLEGAEKPDEGRIKEVVRDVVGSYKAKKNDAREKRVDAKEAKKVELRKEKPPRYFGVLPELDLGKVMDDVFGDVSVSGGGTSGEGKKFWQQLKKGKRVIEKPHITIVHQKQLPQDQVVWESCANVTGVPRTHAPTFECTIGHVLWNGDVMVLVVDDLRLGSSLTLDTKAKGMEARGVQAGMKFLEVIPEEMRNRLHVTVATANAGIKPVEGKTLVERWRAGDREEKGVYEAELKEKFVVEGRLTGLWT
jgi:tRNA ligase